MTTSESQFPSFDWGTKDPVAKDQEFEVIDLKIVGDAINVMRARLKTANVRPTFDPLVWADIDIDKPIKAQTIYDLRTRLLELEAVASGGTCMIHFASNDSLHRVTHNQVDLSTHKSNNQSTHDSLHFGTHDSGQFVSHLNINNTTFDTSRYQARDTNDNSVVKVGHFTTFDTSVQSGRNTGENTTIYTAVLGGHDSGDNSMNYGTKYQSHNLSNRVDCSGEGTCCNIAGCGRYCPDVFYSNLAPHNASDDGSYYGTYWSQNHPTN